MVKKAIVFIDGNNLYHNSKCMGVKLNPSNISKLVQLVCSKFNCIFSKAIYYNSVPSIEDGSEMYYKHLKFLNEVAKLVNFEVKTRKLQRNSNKEVLKEKERLVSNLGLCEVCAPIVKSNCFDCIGSIDKKEKGIDMMIGIDMLNLSVIQKECDCCILISGDADFVPVLELIKRHGKGVASASLTKGYSFELRQKNRFLIIDREFLKEC